MRRFQYWMDASILCSRQSRRMMPPRLPLNVVKLSDHGGQYKIVLTCPCGHSRDADPEVFARIAGWEAELAGIIARLRCSKCGVRGPTATLWRQTKRDR